MALDPQQLGFDGTVEIIRQLLVDRFQLAKEPGSIDLDEPLFQVGVGLTSLEGMELLVEFEKAFGVEINDVDWWVTETPTLATAARYLMALSDKQRRSRAAARESEELP